MFTPSRSGYVHANGTGNARSSIRVEVVEGALFRPVVTQISSDVAGPMSTQAAVSGSMGAQTAIAKRSARAFP